MGDCELNVDVVWREFLAEANAQDLCRCRKLLNKHYTTDYFSLPPEKAAHYNAYANMKPPVQTEMVRILEPPYYKMVPKTKQYISNPYLFTRRYGDLPRARPWESEHEVAAPERTGVNVGRQADLAPLRRVQHKRGWDSSTEVPGEQCNLWHCVLLHKKSLDDRPW